MMGSEEEPDYAYWDGSYEGGVGPERDQIKGSFVTPGERRRFAASKIEPDRRFHYRHIAASLAARAADFLSPRSQAFAAVLCHATDWALSIGEDDEARQLYRRYVKHGALFPWAVHFGHECPEPNFG